MLAASAVLLLLGYTCMLHPRRAGAVPVDTCTSALLSACSSYTDTVLNCNTCTGKSQHDLRVAGCDSPEVSWWCAQIVVQNATERLSVASTVLSGVSLASIPSASGEDPSQAYRESNLISARQTTATTYDAKRQHLFTGNTCDRRSKYSDCKPGTGLIQKWNISSQVVVANLTADILAQLSTPLTAVAGKHLILSGIVDKRAPKVLKAYTERGGELVSQLQENDWVAYHFKFS